MNKKPSELIYNNAMKDCKDMGFSDTDQRIDHDKIIIKSIITYLDEEKERINKVLHEISSMMHDGNFDAQNCNYLHQMIDETLVDNNELEK